MQPLTGRSARPATQRSFPRSHAQAPGVCDERFDGFMAAYREFFGTPAQPNLPARSVMQVAGLVLPGWRVEIEVIAAR